MRVLIVSFLLLSVCLGQSLEETRKKAEQGDAKAQFNLGNCYSEGRGVEKDEVECMKWYRKAAEQGVAEAQNNLGICYANGMGVPKDLVEAYAYLNLVDRKPEQVIKAIMELRDQMSPEQIAAGKKRTKELQKEIEAKMAKKP